MKRNKILFVIAIVAMLAVLFVACDDGSQSEHTHTYGAWSITTAPTATTEGSASRVCACGDTDTVSVAKLSDTSVWSVEISQNATHTSNGFAVYKSEYGTVSTSSAMGQHTYGAWTMTKEPTMSETGSAIKVCDCGHSVEETVPVLSNNVWTKDESNKPAHGVAGSVVYTSDYGTVTIVVPAEEHVYGKWTDNGDGTHTHVCSCGHDESASHTFDQRIASAAFKKADATCTKGAEYYYSCVCGAKGTETFFNGEGTGHTFSEFKLTTAPTCTETGIASVKCSKCDYENENNVISALGHTWDNEWHPYYGNSQYQDEDGNVIVDEDTTSEYHAHACTVCGVFDEANKVAHAFGDEYLVAEKDHLGHQMSTEHACVCGYTETVNDNLGYLEYWTKGEEVAPTYNSAGSIVYTKNNYTYTLVLDKLVAPYDNKTYYFVEARLRDDLTIGGASFYSWSTAQITLDANGEGVGNASPVKGNNKVTMVDATTGKITWAITNDEGSTTTYNGYVDMSTGVVVMSSEAPFVKTVYIGSWLEEGALNQSAFQGSVWGSNMALTYTHDCSIGTHTFNVFINEDGVVAFGVDFKNASGATMSADSIHASDYVVVEKDGTKLDAFAKNGAGNLIATDGMEGTYTYSGSGEGGNVTLDGIGNITMSGVASTDTISGTYTAVSGQSYYDVYFYEDEVATLYMQLTFDSANNTYVGTVPTTSITYTTEYGTVDSEYNTANNNIAFTLPTPVVEGDTDSKVFVGWKLNGEGDYVTSFTPNGTAVTFVADWRNTFTVVTVVDDVNGNSTKTVPTGTSVLSQLPTYETDTISNGYKFVDWYVDTDSDGIFNEDNDDVLDNTTLASADVATMTVFATWSWAGNVTFTEQTGYTFVYDAVNGYWKSNNQGINNSNAVMEFTASEGIVVVSFEYYCESESASRWDFMTIYYGGSTWSTVTAGGKDCNWSWQTITTTLDASIDNSNQKVRITYEKDSSGQGGSDTAYIRNLTINGVLVVSQQPLNNDVAGTYASGETNVVVGAGGLVTIDGIAYAYTTVETNKICVTRGSEYKEITLDKTNGTCTIAIPQVNVTYDMGGHGNNVTTSVNKMSTQTLASAPTADGYIFRGWYTDAEFATEASATFTASADVTFYAKWDKAVTITYVYNDGGAHADETDSTYYANDEITVKTVDFNYGAMVFVGWFKQDGSESGEWGDEFVTGATLTDNITVYAKWVVPSPFMGTYTMVTLLSASSVTVYNSDTTKLVIDAFGMGTTKGYNGFNYNTLVTITAGTGSAVSITHKTGSGGTAYAQGVYDATSGVILRYSGSTLYMMVPYNADYAEADFTMFAWSEDSVYHKLVSFADRNHDNAEVSIFAPTSNSALFGVEWDAKTEEYNPVTSLSNVSENAIMLDVMDAETNIYSYAKDSNGKFVAVDETNASYQGKYTDETAESFVLNGAGMIYFNDGTTTTSGTYTVDAEDAETIYALTSTANYTIIIDKTGKTYDKEDNKVIITYVNDKVTVTSESVYNGISHTLVTSGLEVDGFVFRGWYDNAEYSGNKVTSVTPTENKTYYAKYDVAVSVTFDYNGYTDADSNTSYALTGKYANDTVGTLPTVLKDATFGTKVFNGWYTANGSEGNWGSEVTTTTTLTENVTFYAKWIEPHAMMGSYKGYEVYGNDVASSRADMTITALGEITAGGKTGTITDYNADTGYFILVNDSKKYYGYHDRANGIVIISDASSTTSFGTDAYFYFKDADAISVDKTNVVTWNSNKTRLIPFVVDGETKIVYINDTEVYCNVDVVDKDGNSVTVSSSLKTAGTVITIKQGTNSIVTYGYVGDTFVLSDGANGAYTTDGDGVGSITVDGYGNATISGSTVTYTLDGNNITFVYNNRMYILTLDKTASTYTQAQDGYQGTYTMPDNSTITLDGYGMVTGTTKTYVVSGATITIYDGETSTAYGIDTENKALLGKSKFAGLTFTGSSYKLVFDDSSAISGTFKSTSYPVYEYGFTGTYVGNVLTLTITSQNYSMGFVGKTITATVEDGKITFTSSFKYDNTTDINGTSATNADFVA